MNTHHAVLLHGTSIRESALPDVYKEQSVDVLHLCCDRFSIDDARELAVSVLQTPFASTERVFVLQARDIAVEAQNALLKLLEEPPAYAVFYLVIPQTASLLPTLLSRLHVERSEAKQSGETDAFTAFLRASYAERLACIGEKTKQKDQEWIEAIMEGCEQVATSSGNRSPFLLETVLFARRYGRTKGASAKMLLEELSLLLPRA